MGGGQEQKHVLIRGTQIWYYLLFQVVTVSLGIYFPG